MTPAERNKLIGILGRLASPYDGERAAAGLLATRLLTNAKETWENLLTPHIEYRGPTAPPPSSRTWRDDLTLCAAYYDALSDWERGFLSSVAQRTRITDKQLACLQRIVQRIRSRGL